MRRSDFSSSVSSFLVFESTSSPVAFFVALTFSLLFTTVSNTSEPSARKPSIFMIASMASLLDMIFLRVSLSTLTRRADSHLRASRVADVPAIAMSRMPPASTWVMWLPSNARTGKKLTKSLTAFSGFDASGLRPMPYSATCRRARVGAKSNTKQTGLRISSSFGLSPFGFMIDHGDCTRKAAWK